MTPAKLHKRAISSSLVPMNFEFTGSKWFLLFIAIVLPLLLLVVALVLEANICIVMALLVLMGIALIMLYLPKGKK
jgi:hypothetical protein